jgi:excisionase family DNA binding protein
MSQDHDQPSGDLLTTGEAAKYLGISRQVIAQAAKDGTLIAQQHRAPGTGSGWIYMFTKEELDRWFARDRKAPGRPSKNDGTATLGPRAAA